MSEHAAGPVKGRDWKAWVSLICTVLMVVSLLVLALKQTSNKNDVQEKNDVLVDTSLNLAEQVKRACAKGGATAAALGSACGQANAIVTQPAVQKGERGIAGKQGPPGPQGINGIPGPRGPAGKNGKDGAKGEPGSNGADGAAGVNGKDGAPGPSGATGAQGEPGPAGKDGADGKDGTNGKDGAPPASASCVPDPTTPGQFICTFGPPTAP